MKVFRSDSRQRQEVDWRGVVDPHELARHVNDLTSRVYAAMSWPEWWALRSSRRLAMEPWSKDLAAARILRQLLEEGRTLEVEEASPTLPLLLRSEEKTRIQLEKETALPASRPWRAFLLWLLKRVRNRIILWRLPKVWKHEQRFDLLIHTVVLPENVTSGGKLNDMFFPGVQDCAESRRKKALTVGFAPALPWAARKWRRTGNWVLLDEVLRLREIKAVFLALRRTRRRIGAWQEDIAGIPAAWLKARWMDDLQQPEFFDSIAAAGWFGSFCREKSVGCYLYSFERKTFEQAILQAIQERSPATETCGYQNAAVTNKHYHFWSYSAGKDVIPNHILTVGQVTTEILTRDGAYPKERVRISGALRQRSLMERKVLRRPLKDLLVLWAESRDQYEKFWKFLRQAWDGPGLDRYFFRIRLHPAIAFDFPDGEKYADRYRVDSLDDIRQSIDWADAILYASTSLAIVAVGSGIPIISIRLPDCFDDDCVPRDSRLLHWRVEKPCDLEKTLQRIEGLYDEDFVELLSCSQEFGRRYFQPATAAGFLQSLGAGNKDRG